MKKLRNLEWGNYRHPEFLKSLDLSVNELKFIRVFLKRGSVALVNEVLREQKPSKIILTKTIFPPDSENEKKLKRNY